MLASCLFAVALLMAFLLPAAAGQGDGYSRLRPLFGFQEPRSDPPRRAGKARKPDAGTARPAERKRKARAPAPAAAAAVPSKAPDAKVVLVFGDGFGQALAAGLEESFSDMPGVRILDAALPNRGLTGNGASLPPAGGSEPAAIVVMLGGNDRRSLRREGERLPLRSPGWNEVFAGRAAALADDAKRRNIPLVWIGLPAVASAKASADFLAFNEIFRSATEAGGGLFIDSWDGFVDETGAFTTFGPDVDGQNTRLRTRDGLGFTRAGRRKLAFFAARPLAKALDLPLPAGLPPEPTSDAPAAALPPGRTAPMALYGTSPAGGESSELLGGPGAAPIPAGGASLYDVPSVPGRADDFTAPPAGPTPEAATP